MDNEAHMLNLNDVFLFVQVVDHRGFSPAARALQMPKSSLSNRIIKLEDRLGARLLQRTSRRFAVTDLGKEFYQHASAMLIEAGAAEDVVRRRLAEPAGTVRLTSSVGTSHAGLAVVLARFVKEFPKVRLLQHASNRTVDLVDEGLDLAVRAHQGALPDSELVQRRLGFSPRWLVAAKSYLSKMGVPQEPAELVHHEGLCMPAMPVDSEWRLQCADGSTTGVPITSRFCVDDLQTLRIAASQGVGIAALPAGLCHADVESGSLIRVLPEWIAGGSTITILTPHRRGELPSVRALSDFVAHHLRVIMRLEL
jgi:DNA-binding transcriptional LysR family regulator